MMMPWESTLLPFEQTETPGGAEPCQEPGLPDQAGAERGLKVFQVRRKTMTHLYTSKYHPQELRGNGTPSDSKAWNDTLKLKSPFPPEEKNKFFISTEGFGFHSTFIKGALFFPLHWLWLLSVETVNWVLLEQSAAFVDHIKPDCGTDLSQIWSGIT